MFAPFIPSITEEIYSSVYEDEFDKTKSISCRGNWPIVDDFIEDDKVEKIGSMILNIITDVRKYKSDKNVSIKEILKSIDIYGKFGFDEGVIEDLKNVCNIEIINFIYDNNYNIKFND